MYNIITKLFSIFIVSTLFASCVSNSDEIDPPTPQPSVPLTKQSLAGEWEVFFFTKKIVPKNGGESNYRYTENDGFRATFNEDGTYSENNSMGYETYKGTYKIVNFAKESADYDKDKKFSGASENSDLVKDGLLLYYIADKKDKNGNIIRDEAGQKIKIDTIALLNIPKMFGDHFTFRDRYIGGAQGHSYTLEDNRYFRRMGTAYLPEGAEFKKNIIDINDLLGRWEQNSALKRVENNIVNVKFAKDRHLFRIVNGKHEYYEFEEKELIENPTNPQANRFGEFKIFDDVVNMYINEPVKNKDGVYLKDENGKFIREWKNYKWWIKDKIDLYKGIERIRTYDKYRDIQNTLLEIEEFESYKKVSNN